MNCGWPSAPAHDPRSAGREVKVPSSAEDKIKEAAPLQTAGCLAERQMTSPLPLSKWRQLGVTTKAGTRLPSASIEASLVDVPARDDGHGSTEDTPKRLAVLQ